MLFDITLSGLVASGFLWTTTHALPQQDINQLIPRAPPSHVLPIRRRPAREEPHPDAVAALQRRAVGSAPLRQVLGFEYVVDMTWGTQPFTFVVDTGSADTFVAGSNLVCVDSQGNVNAQSACAFASSFQGNFSGGALENQVISGSFQDGEFFNGSLGLQDITIGGLQMKNQQVAILDNAFFLGDNITSGVMGLAFPTLTRGFKVDPTTGEGTRQTYDPIITGLINQGLVDAPQFSLALDRAGDRGVLTLGGIPPVTLTSEFAKTPILIVSPPPLPFRPFSSAKSKGANNTNPFQRQLTGNPAQATNLSFYTIEPDAYTATSANAGTSLVNNTKFPVFVDSGASFFFLPTALGAQIYALFVPPATIDPTTGLATAPCDATPPSFSVTIGGQAFPVSAVDMLVQAQGRAPVPDGHCLVGIQDGGDGPFALGDTFLNNVLTVFDQGVPEMRFATFTF